MRVSNIILEDKHGHGKWRQVLHNTFMNYEHCVNRFWWHKLATHAQLGEVSCYLQNVQQLQLWGSSKLKETLHTNGLLLCRKTWVIILGSTTPKSEQPSQREKWTPFRSGAIHWVRSESRAKIILQVWRAFLLNGNCRATEPTSLWLWYSNTGYCCCQCVN